MSHKRHALIVHGISATPGFSWYPWLKDELTKKGYEVKVPQMPNPVVPNIDNWIMKIMDNIEDAEHTTIIAHSLGALSTLLYLNIYGGRPFPKVILIGVPVRILDDPDLAYLKEFLKAYDQIDWEGIRSVVKEFVLIHGENDTVVPYDHGVHLSSKLGVPLITTKEGHYTGRMYPSLLKYFDD